eukprot:6344513-Pyramimonas_sp.AAC.1
MYAHNPQKAPTIVSLRQTSETPSLMDPLTSGSSLVGIFPKLSRPSPKRNISDGCARPFPAAPRLPIKSTNRSNGVAHSTRADKPNISPARPTSGAVVFWSLSFTLDAMVSPPAFHSQFTAIHLQFTSSLPSAAVVAEIGFNGVQHSNH